jgi:hypothetical protein
MSAWCFSYQHDGTEQSASKPARLCAKHRCAKTARPYPRTHCSTTLRFCCYLALLLCLCMVCPLSYVDHFTYKNTLCIITDCCEHGDLYQFLQARKQHQGHSQLPEAQVEHPAAHTYSSAGICASLGQLLAACSHSCKSRCRQTGNTRTLPAQ